MQDPKEGAFLVKVLGASQGLRIGCRACLTSQAAPLVDCFSWRLDLVRVGLVGSPE